MVWEQKPVLSARVRMACPVLELFHPYKKLLEDTWKQREFFYTFFSPLRHSYNPGSGILAKPKLKEIEAVATTLALIWPGYRPQLCSTNCWRRWTKELGEIIFATSP